MARATRQELLSQLELAEVELVNNESNLDTTELTAYTYGLPNMDSLSVLCSSSDTIRTYYDYSVNKIYIIKKMLGLRPYSYFMT